MVRRSSLAEAISHDIAQRDFTGQGVAPVQNSSPADEDFTHPVAEPKHKKLVALIRVRMDGSDYKKFQSIAKSLGTNGSCLIRQYVKKVIKTGEA
jgi:hypothetical protein